MPDSVGSGAQVRIIAEQVVDAALARVPQPSKVEIPPPLRWAATIIGGLMTVGSAGLLFWMISSISAMQITLGRVDERMLANTLNWENKLKNLDERLARVEANQKVH